MSEINVLAANIHNPRLAALRRAFAAQLEANKPITEEFFNLTEEDRLNWPHKVPTPEQWESYLSRRRFSEFGTRREAGDIILWAIFYERRDGKLFMVVRTLLERELPKLARLYDVLPQPPRTDGKPRIMPTLVPLENGRWPDWLFKFD